MYVYQTYKSMKFRIFFVNNRKQLLHLRPNFIGLFLSQEKQINSQTEKASNHVTSRFSKSKLTDGKCSIAPRDPTEATKQQSITAKEEPLGPTIHTLFTLYCSAYNHRETGKSFPFSRNGNSLFLFYVLLLQLLTYGSSSLVMN